MSRVPRSQSSARQEKSLDGLRHISKHVPIQPLPMESLPLSSVITLGAQHLFLLACLSLPPCSPPSQDQTHPHTMES